MSNRSESDKDQPSRDELVSMGVCPDCWESKSYYNQYLNYVEDRTKADIHGPKDQKKAFIEKYVQDNITGIKLRNEKNRQYCPACEKNYLFKPGRVKDQKASGSDE